MRTGLLLYFSFLFSQVAVAHRDVEMRVGAVQEKQCRSNIPIALALRVLQLIQRGEKKAIKKKHCGTVYGFLFLCLG